MSNGCQNSVKCGILKRLHIADTTPWRRRKKNKIRKWRKFKQNIFLFIAEREGEKNKAKISIILEYLLFSVNSVLIELKYPFQSVHKLWKYRRKNGHIIVKSVLLSILMDCVRQKWRNIPAFCTLKLSLMSTETVIACSLSNSLEVFKTRMAFWNALIKCSLFSGKMPPLRVTQRQRN